MTDWNPPPPPEPPRSALRAGPVIGGLVVGVVVGLVYIVAAFIAAYAVASDGSSGVVWLLFVVPAVVGAVLLAVPRSRRAGAGFVLGLAIGLIVFPAVCATPVLLGG